ncbi:MAG: helix-turn-helix domain-containing protein [Kiritimatiellae bacterium]|nr:helix-turn-helix domain-containing protein [Kiritimatiellia bacterium]
MLWGVALTVIKRNAAHAHDMHEFVVCMSDTGRHEVDGRLYEFRAGRTIFLPSGVSHYVIGSRAQPASISFACFDDFSFVEDEPALRHVLQGLVTGRRYASRCSEALCRENLVLARRLQAEFDVVRPFSQAMARSILSQLLINHCRSLGTSASGEPDAHARRIFDMCDWIVQHYAADITLQDTAGKAGMSRTLFARQFRLRTGMSLIEFVMAARIHAAMRLLHETRDPITDIAFRCGFRNLGHFYRTFKRLCHMTPRAYRRVAGSRGPFIRKLKVLSEGEPAPRRPEGT